MLTGTAGNLLDMTDRAAFERLALQVLRCAEPDCASVIRLGTNEHGETVVSPLDGFACASGTAVPLYVAVESTTTDAGGLERKWLYDHTTYVPGKKPSKAPPTASDDGDLLKAAREAQTLRQGQPNAKCKVYLATNQTVSSALRAKVDQVAHQLGVECDVWEQSRIADYLDIDPTGQYLRSKYFGTPAERLSKDLLLEVGSTVRQQYAHAGRVSSKPVTWAPRSLDLELLARTDDPTTRLILLVGESGFGKTVAAHRAMDTWLRRGDPALWIRAEQLEASNSLHAGIDAVIRDRVPTIAEYSVRSLSPALGASRILLVVDDINRTQSPTVLLRKLLAWSSSTQEAVVICPVWPRFLDAFHLAERKDVSLVRIGSFAPTEAEAALGGTSHQDLAAALNYDPFLIGIARTLAGSGVGIRPSTKAREVLSLFVDHELELLRSGNSGSHAVCHKSEHEQALEHTSRAVLEHRKLDPTAAQVQAWIADERLWAAMVEILDGSGIAWTTPRNQISYRHDRLRDHLLAQAMKALLARGQACPALADPYFAEVSAEALAQLGAPEHLVATLKDAEPLVLVLALPLVDVGSDDEARIADALSEWFAEERTRRGRVRVRFTHKDSSANTVHVAGTFNNWSRSDEAWKLARTPATDEWALVAWMRPGTYPYKIVVDGERWVGSTRPTTSPDGFGGFNAVATIPTDKVDAHFALTSARARLMVRELTRTDSVVVLDVVRGLPEGDFDVLVARFRNGDVRAGIKFCQSPLADPTMRYVVRADAIASVRRLHLNAFAHEFRELARDIDSDEERLGAIVLAGHIGHPGMVDQAGQLWQESSARRRLLPQAIWAQLRSAEPSFGIIEVMMDAVLELEEHVRDGAHISEQGVVTEFLRLSGLRVGQSVVTWLLTLMERKPELKWMVWTLLARVDLPDAVEAMARLAAKAAESAREKGGFSLAASMLGDGWRNGQMSLASARRLQEIWQSDRETQTVRWQAFSLWRLGALRHADAHEILRSVPEDSPFFDAALRGRALLGDLSAEPAFAKMLSRTCFGARAGSCVWGANISAVVDARLAQWGDNSDDSYDLADLLTLAPVEDARKLFIKNWGRLRLVPRFLQAALTVGGAELEALVAETMASWPPDGPAPLEFAVLHMEMGHEDGLVVPVDKRRIERLLAYSERLDGFDRRRLGELSRKHGLALWGRERIGPLLDEDARALLFPTEGDLKRSLDGLLGDERAHSLRAAHLAEHAEERSDGLYDVLGVLDDWLSENRSETALTIAAEMIIACGRRSGVDVLARHSDLSMESHVQRLADVELQVYRASP